MLDLKLIEEKPDFVKAALAKKGWDFDPAPVLKLISERRDLLKEVEANKAEQNKLSASVPSVKKAGGNVQEIFAKVRELAAQNKDKEVKLAQVEKRHASLGRSASEYARPRFGWRWQREQPSDLSLWQRADLRWLQAEGSRRTRREPWASSITSGA
jgi:SMC interacting uncharacterized protein involved in chromosome segregation